MFAKFVVVLALVAVASAGDYSSFSYGVADPYSGDIKHQVENRAGDNVRGQYSLLESDGTRRTVDYTAGIEGFNAIVRKDPASLAAATLPYTAPLYHRSSPIYANLGYGAIGYAAPYAYRRFF